jgi:4-carboxymuconolactone decarboxylase
MARLPYVDPDTASASVVEVLDGLPPLNIFRMIANADDVFVPWLRWAGAVLNETQLDPAHRQLAILRIAALSPGSEYMLVQHEGIAEAIGMSPAWVEAARTGTGLEGDEAIILQASDEIIRNVSPSDETWERLAARFTPRQIVELLLVIGQYMMVARISATTQLDVDPPQGNRGVEALRDQVTPG